MKLTEVTVRGANDWGVPVLVQVESESDQGTMFIQMTSQDAVRAKQLLNAAQETGEWPEEVNKIIRRSKKLRPVGIINTMGDGWGWYSTRRR